MEGWPLAGLLLALVTIGSGIFIASAIQRVTLEADRRSGTLAVRRRLLLWPVPQGYDLRLADLDSVHVASHTLRTGRHIVTSYSVDLATGARGKPYGLTFLPMFTEAAAQDIARIILAWLRREEGATPNPARAE